MSHNTTKVLTKVSHCVATLFPPPLPKRFFTAVDYLVKPATASAENMQIKCKEESLPPRDETLLPYSYRTPTNKPSMSVELETCTPLTHDRHLATRGRREVINGKNEYQLIMLHEIVASRLSRALRRYTLLLRTTVCPSPSHIKLPNWWASHPLLESLLRLRSDNYFTHTVGSDLRNRNGPRLRSKSLTKKRYKAVHPFRQGEERQQPPGTRKPASTGTGKPARNHLSGNISTKLRETWSLLLY